MTILESIVNATYVNSRSTCPSCLLSFEILNYNVYNFLVGSSASLNFMPLYVSNKINMKWETIDTIIIKLDRSLVQAIGELNNVIIHLSSNRRVQQCIDIVNWTIQKLMDCF